MKQIELNNQIDLDTDKDVLTHILQNTNLYYILSLPDLIRDVVFTINGQWCSTVLLCL